MCYLFQTIDSETVSLHYGAHLCCERSQILPGCRSDATREPCDLNIPCIFLTGGIFSGKGRDEVHVRIWIGFSLVKTGMHHEASDVKRVERVGRLYFRYSFQLTMPCSPLVTALSYLVGDEVHDVNNPFSDVTWTVRRRVRTCFDAARRRICLLCL
jgi:hypothetical protein